MSERAAERRVRGRRQTPQRRLVWEAVSALGGHCTADEIATRIPDVSRATIYRALEALLDAGALQAVRLGEGAVHYEVAGEAHQHAVCRLCGGVFHIEQELVLELERHLEELHRFHPLRTEVVVTGVCDACARLGGKAAPGRSRRSPQHEHQHFHPAAEEPSRPELGRGEGI